MYEYLKQHPEIFMPEWKEPHFFGDIMPPNRSVRNEEKYEALFADANDEKRLGEASVFYLYSDRAAAQIKKYKPDARIIIMLRDPVDMMYSWHSERYYHGQEVVDDFEAALALEEDRKKGLNVPANCTHYSPFMFFYREIAKYTDHVKRYLDIFGKDNVHIIIFDDLKKDVDQAYRGTLEFLDVDISFKPEFSMFNQNKRERNKKVQNFITRPPHFIYLIATRIIPLAVREKMISMVLRLNSRREPRPPMAVELRQRLEEEFAPEVERLSDFIQRELSVWTQSASK